MTYNDGSIWIMISVKFAPTGLMFPSCADIHLAPFTDEQLYCEHHARAAFWSHTHTHTLTQA